MSQEQAELQLQNALTTTFLANLVFLSEYDNELYQRVDTLSQMIQSGEYEEKYALDFILEDGEFDIYDIVNDRYIYNRKPKKEINKLINEVQFDTKNAIFTLGNVYDKKSVKQIPREMRVKLQTLEELDYLTYSDIFDYTSLLKDNLTAKKKRLKKIDKFVFFGTLLGRHIPKIAEKIDANIYMVCEKNLEIFRLSLFAVDYTILAKNSGVVFSIMNDEEIEQNKIITLLTNERYRNFCIKFSNTSFNTKHYIEDILKQTVAMQATIYDYNRYLYIFIKRVFQRVAKYNTLLVNKTKDGFSFFEDKRVLFIAAGPSLDDSIEWIKTNQDKFFIVSIGAAYEKLLDNGIKVDMITTLDEQYKIVGTKHFSPEATAKLKDTIILASNITHSEVLERFNPQNLILYEVYESLYEKASVLDGFSVGELSVELLLRLNVKELYLVGLDMALDQKTGQTHSKSSSSNSIEYEIEKLSSQSFEESKKDFGLRSGLIEVRGNMQNIVQTTGFFSSSISFLNKTLRIFKTENTAIYNLSRNGAYFFGTEALDIDDIKVEQLSNLEYQKDEFLEDLKPFIVSSLTKSRKKELEDEYKVMKEFLENRIELLSSKEYKSFEEFFDDTKELKNKLIENSRFFAFVIENYYQIVIEYLAYHFNDIKLKDENKKLKALKEIFSKHLRVLLEDYIEFLSKVIK